AFAAGVRAQALRHLQELLFGASARRGDHLRRVPLIVPAQDVHHATGVFERWIGRRWYVLNAAQALAPGRSFDLRRCVGLNGAAGLAFVGPAAALGIVLTRLRIQSAEVAVEVLGVLKLLVKNCGRVGERNHVLAEPALVLE